MSAAANPAKLLLRSYLHAQARNPLFSKRAFARKLGIGAGTLSEILQGKRRVSIKMAGRLADRLLLDPQTRSEWLNAAAADKYESLVGKKIQPVTYHALEADQFALIADWVHHGILCLIETRGFRPNPEWIASRFAISEKAASDALTRLERLGLIERRAGRLKVTQSHTRTSDGVANLAIRRSHAQDFELARRSLDDDPIEARDVSSITMAIAPEKLPRAKVLIRRFQDELAELLEAEPPTEVYRLTMALFPLTVTKNRRRS